MLLSRVQLDPETIVSLVARSVITEDDAGLLKNETISHSRRVFETLRPAIVQGGQQTLEAFYRTLLCTSEGRLGHKELAEAIKRRGKLLAIFEDCCRQFHQPCSISIID